MMNLFAETKSEKVKRIRQQNCKHINSTPDWDCEFDNAWFCFDCRGRFIK